MCYYIERKKGDLSMCNDVLYTVNKKYLPIFLASLYSLLENGNLDNLRIHLITDGFDIEDFNKVHMIVDKFPGVKLNTYDLSVLNIESLNIPDWRGTQIANARLFINSILDLHDVTNLLYIDADTIIVGPLDELKEKYSKSVVCACLDGCSRKYGEELAGLDKYYNSGIIYFNVNKWIGIEAEDRIKHVIRTSDKEFRYPDQDIFNIALKNFITELPIEYNMAPYAYCLSEKQLESYFREGNKNYGYNKVVAARKNTKILHSVGLFGIKPWTRNKVNPFNDVFMEYLLKVDPTFVEEELPIIKKLFSFSPELFYSIITLRSRIPEPLDKITTSLNLKLQQTKKR